MVTADRVRALLDYDQVTGHFTWRVDRPSCTPVPIVLAGAVAGTICPNGKGKQYRRIVIDGRYYKAHRLAWLYVYGVWPANQIDHINGDGMDNRFANLREATNAQNQANQLLSCRNKSGFKGVYWQANTGKWAANIRVHKKLIYLGAFDQKECAASAYQKAADKHFNEFARAS